MGAYLYDFDKLSKSVLYNKKRKGVYENYSFASTEKYLELSAITKLKKEK